MQYLHIFTQNIAVSAVLLRKTNEYLLLQIAACKVRATY